MPALLTNVDADVPLHSNIESSFSTFELSQNWKFLNLVHTLFEILMLEHPVSISHTDPSYDQLTHVHVTQNLSMFS